MRHVILAATLAATLVPTGAAIAQQVACAPDEDVPREMLEQMLSVSVFEDDVAEAGLAGTSAGDARVITSLDDGPLCGQLVAWAARVNGDAPHVGGRWTFYAVNDRYIAMHWIDPELRGKREVINTGQKHVAFILDQDLELIVAIGLLPGVTIDGSK